MQNSSTRDSQNVRGHFSHLLNVFKFHFIFRKRGFHSLINAHDANVKQRTAVVPEKIDFEYVWGGRSGSSQICE